MSAPVNYTTQVPVSRTVAEIQDTLVRYGAARIGVDYENGAASRLMFTLDTSVGVRTYSLPASVDKMHRLMIRRGNEGKLGSLSRAKWQSEEQAARVAWRVLKDWLTAQLALIDTEMVALEVVMLPYLMVDQDRTLYQAWYAGETLALEAAR